MAGILSALRWIEEIKPLKSVICSDSMSVLQSFLSGNSTREDLVIEVKHLLAHIRNMGLTVEFCWVPAHIGVKGNEIADHIAKDTIGKEHIDIHIPLGKGEAKALIKTEIMKRWQKEWETEPKGRQFFHVQSHVWGKRITSMGFNRHEEVVYTRLRLGHTGLNATLHILGKSDGLCQECRVKEDVEHVLFQCSKYSTQRQKWLELEAGSDIHNILKEEGMQRKRMKALMSYLNDTGLIKRI